MAEGGADPETGAQDQETTGAGESGEQQAGAGPASGEKDQAEKLQAVHDKAQAEVRETLEPKIKELRSENESLRTEIEELKGETDKRKSPEDRPDVYTEEEVRELISEKEQQLEQTKNAVESANRATERSRLLSELSGRVVEPELVADSLQKRVEADVTEGLDHIVVYTPEGNKMLTSDGEPATVADLVDRFVAEHPGLAKDQTQTGSGFERGGESRPSSLKERQREAEQSGDLETAGQVKAQRAISGAT